MSGQAYEQDQNVVTATSVRFTALTAKTEPISKAFEMVSTTEGEERNRKTLDGIASLLKKHPLIGCVIDGQTGKAAGATAGALDIQETYDHIAKQRAEACRTYLVKVRMQSSPPQDPPEH